MVKENAICAISVNVEVEKRYFFHRVVRDDANPVYPIRNKILGQNPS